MTTYEKYSVALSSLTLIAVVVTATIYYFQLREMRRGIGQPKKQLLRNRTLDLALEFWSPAMVGHRNRLWKRVSEVLAQPPRHSEDKRASLVRFYDDRGPEDQLWIDFLIVQGFFLKTAKQAREGRLDPDICQRQFGRQFTRFYDSLFVPGLQGVSPSDPDGWGEVNDDYCFLARWLKNEQS